MIDALAAWRKHKHPRLADAIDRIPCAVKPFTGTLTARIAAWAKRAEKLDPHDVPTLRALPWPKRPQDLVTMTYWLQKFPDDPRIAAALMDFLEHHHQVRTPSMHSCCFFARKRIYEIGDLRTNRRFATLTGEWKNTNFADLGIEPALKTALVPLVARLEAKYGAAASATDEPALLAAIYAEPDADGPREVYADWLGERDDPRGAFIVAQLRGEPAGAPEVAWAGAIARYFDGDLRFARGMFAGGKLRHAIDGVAREPAWTLVRHVEVARLEAFACGAAALDRVEVLGVLQPHHVRTLPRLPHLRALYHVVAGEDDVELATLKIAALPALDTLGLQTSDAGALVPWLASAPVLERLTRLVIYDSPMPVPARMELAIAAIAQRAGVRELVIGHRDFERLSWECTLSRPSARGPFVRAALRYHLPPRPSTGVYAHQLSTVLDVLPDSLAEVAITHAMKPKKAAYLDAALARFAGRIR